MDMRHKSGQEGPDSRRSCGLLTGIVSTSVRHSVPGTAALPCSYCDRMCCCHCREAEGNMELVPSTSCCDTGTPIQHQYEEIFHGQLGSVPPIYYTATPEEGGCKHTGGL